MELLDNFRQSDGAIRPDYYPKAGFFAKNTTIAGSFSGVRSPDVLNSKR
jgi:hypothetical protein